MHVITRVLLVVACLLSSRGVTVKKVHGQHIPPTIVHEIGVEWFRGAADKWPFDLSQTNFLFLEAAMGTSAVTVKVLEQIAPNHAVNTDTAWIEEEPAIWAGHNSYTSIMKSWQKSKTRHRMPVFVVPVSCTHMHTCMFVGIMHTHTYIYIYIYTYICVCVCVL
jgi:hypothetical protein